MTEFYRRQIHNNVWKFDTVFVFVSFVNWELKQKREREREGMRERKIWTAKKVDVLVCSIWHNKHHRLDGLNNRNLFLTVLETGSSRSRCQQVSLILTPLLLACRWPPSHYVLTWPHLSAQVEREWVINLPSPLLIRPPVLWD